LGILPSNLPTRLNFLPETTIKMEDRSSDTAPKCDEKLTFNRDKNK